MKINEIFYSIQGEGKWTGLPNIFIRTTGCNLRCSYCDTKYAYEKGIEKTIQEITKEIKKYKCKKICITGGEPLQQKDIIELINHLIDLTYNILVETNGSLKIDSLKDKKNLIISLDIKTPSSKMHEKMFLQNINLLRKKDQIKFIIKNKKDYNYAKKIIQKYKPKCDIFFQPVWKTNSEKLAKWILEDNLKVKLGLQIHKIIWGDKKGV
ncbi:MAG: radical SAM protein [Candidatus Thermoplasmatota archaeon]|nr:radical SAM protein [Candidatus Thermoplasmatota archaeon]